MNVNFQLEDNIALNFKSKYIDLHNSFDFVNFEYKVETQTLILRWFKFRGDWVKKDELEYFALIHKEVIYLSISARDPEMPNTEDNCLSEISYFPSSDRDSNDKFTDQKSPNDGDDIFYCF